MIVAGMRPRSLTLYPRCFAHALISPLRSRPGPVRDRRRRPPALALRAVVRVLANLIAQFLGVLGAHIDLVGSAVKGELNCLLTLNLPIVGKVADDRHLHLLCHGGQPFR